MSLFNMKNSKQKNKVAQPTKQAAKPQLNVLLASPYYTSEDYIDFLNRRWNVNIIDLEDRFDCKIDLMLFSGGADVHPKYYKEKETGSRTATQLKRDEHEASLFWDHEYVPKLGICRGSQFLTAMSGGQLVQHVENHTSKHDITINAKKTRYQNVQKEITSTHHQMMFPFNLQSNRYELLAWSTYFRSNTYLNGADREKELPANFLEPEIVFYNRTNSLCIQGHPEFRACAEETKEMCLDLIDSYLINTKK